MAFGLIQFGFGFLVKVGVLVQWELNRLFPKPNKTDQKANPLPPKQTTDPQQSNQWPQQTQLAVHHPCIVGQLRFSHETPNVNATKHQNPTTSMLQNQDLPLLQWRSHCLSFGSIIKDCQLTRATMIVKPERKICELSRINIKININGFQNLDQIFTKMPLPFYQNKKGISKHHAAVLQK